MSLFAGKQPRRVLIASNHPLFAQGLRSLLEERHTAGGPDAAVIVVGVVSNLKDALAALDRLNPDLIIVDYDDQALNRDEFLARFVEGERKLRVVLLSLQKGGEAIVYDRRTLAASQIDTWLEEWGSANEPDSLHEVRLPPGPRPAAQAAVRPADQVKDKNRRIDMKHFVVASILVVLMTALLIVGMRFVPLLPAQSSAQAATIDALFDLEFKVIAFLFSLIMVFIVYSLVVFRRRRGDLTDAAHIEGSTKLEIAWTIAPLLTVLYFAYLGGINLAETMRPAPKALEVNVIGFQWSWRFEYPELGIVSNELVLPVNRQALLHLSSQDVIHSFWVPEFRVKQDALPGGEDFVRDLRVTPIETGDFKLRCAELCGLQHTTMLADVRVLNAADYQAWVDEQAGASDDPVARGEKASSQFGCLACHSVDGTPLVGPSWKGLYESERQFTDGSTAIADEAYLHTAIVDPQAQIVQGFPPAMPETAAAGMSEEQIADVIEFIKSLK